MSEDLRAGIELLTVKLKLDSLSLIFWQTPEWRRNEASKEGVGVYQNTFLQQIGHSLQPLTRNRDWEKKRKC